MAGKDVVAAIESRIKSPYFGYAFLTFIAINWKYILLLVFSEKSIEHRIVSFESSTNVYELLVLPLAVGLVVAAIAPWMSYAFQYISKRPIGLSTALVQDAEHASFIRKKRLERTLTDLSSDRERELIDRAKRDEEISSIESTDVRLKLEDELNKVRKERDNLSKKAKMTSIDVDIEKAQEMLDKHKYQMDKAANNMDQVLSNKHKKELDHWQDRLSFLKRQLDARD